MKAHRIAVVTALAFLAGTLPAAPAPKPPAAPPAELASAAPPSATLRSQVDQAMKDAAAGRPCYLFTKNLRSGAQLRFVGAPLMPWPSDSRRITLQARFPLVTVAW